MRSEAQWKRLEALEGLQFPQDGGKVVQTHTFPRSLDLPGLPGVAEVMGTLGSSTETRSHWAARTQGGEGNLGKGRRRTSRWAYP